MKIAGESVRSIRPVGDGVEIIDQTCLPHALRWRRLTSLEDAAEAIVHMRVRGAPLIGATAAYGLALGIETDARDGAVEQAAARLLATRPTAVNLAWAVERVKRRVLAAPVERRAPLAWQEAAAICDEDVAINRAIGSHGLKLMEALAHEHGQVEVMTHCNAGWLATVDYGTALAPVYSAHDAGIPVHVWVSETRPRNQGAALTAWELASHGVPHTVIADNAAGHLLASGRVHLVIVGADRVARNGDTANKIGTYLKALAARAHGVPFYVALPSPTFDPSLPDGDHIPIETRAAEEVTHVFGAAEDGRIERVRIAPATSPAFNPAFDITPAALVTAFITERGIVPPTREALAEVFADVAEVAHG